jgi:hypothetical protein
VDLSDVVGEDFYSKSGPTQGWMIIVGDAGHEDLWLDFYIDDEDGETSDDGDSLSITVSELEQLTFEPTYENFHDFRGIAREVHHDMTSAIKIANEKLTNK